MVKFKKQSAAQKAENLITVNTGKADYPIRNNDRSLTRGSYDIVSAQTKLYD